MTIIDDFRKKTEDGLKTLRETAEEIAFSVEKQARIARKRLDIARIQRKIQKLCGEVGEYVYGEYTMERPVTYDSPFIGDRMLSISAMKAEIREVEDEIIDIRNAQPPDKERPVGGEEMPHGPIL
jgi:hypothetical protein